MEENRIYVVVAATVRIPPDKTVVQPAGRQIAQACHVVSKLRAEQGPCSKRFEPITTVVLQARDFDEMYHVYKLLYKADLRPVYFFDTNPEAYGPGVGASTAIAAYATKKQVVGILDYLPLWGAE